MAVVTLQPKQIAELTNNAVKGILGEENLLKEDLTNVIDMGVSLENASAYKNFITNLIVEIAKKVFVSRRYSSKAPNVLRDTYEWGQITQKTRALLPEASDNQSWQLQDGASYDDNIFIADEVRTKLFKDTDTWEIRRSITEKQIKNAFKSSIELGTFLSMIMTQVDNAITLRLDMLVMRTLDNFIGEVLNTNNATRAVNLLANYKKIHTDSTLNANTCIYDKEFLKYATGQIKEYQGLIANYSTIFNEAGAQVFTPKELQHLVLLEKFEANCTTYLESDTFHNEFVSLPYHDTVSYWQNMGQDASFANKSSIDITTSNGNSVKKSGIIGCLFDHDALGVILNDPDIEVHYVRSGQFYNYWYKHHNQYFNDLDENCIVFYVAD